VAGVILLAGIHAGSNSLPFNFISRDNAQAVIGRVFGRNCHQNYRGKGSLELGFPTRLIVKGFKPHPIPRFEIAGLKSFKFKLYFSVRLHLRLDAAHVPFAGPLHNEALHGRLSNWS